MGLTVFYESYYSLLIDAASYIFQNFESCFWTLLGQTDYCYKACSADFTTFPGADFTTFPGAWVSGWLVGKLDEVEIMLDSVQLS